MEGRYSRRCSSAELAGACVLAVLIAACALGRAQPSRAVPVDAGAATIRVALDARGRGAFLLDGLLSDSGRAAARRSLAQGRLHLVATLEGSAGTIVLRVTQRCGRKASTWRVARGSGAYAGLAGGGSGSGLSCRVPRTRVLAVYRGRLQTAPPRAPVAEPGAYGGWSSQNERLTLDVAPDGRHLTNVRLERLVAACSNALSVVVEPALLATYPIADDGSFSISSGGSTIGGRFSGSQAEGAISYESSDGGSTCSSGSVTWTASSPPPPLPSPQPGAYCGSTSQQVGVCLKVTGDRKVGGLRMEAVLECVQPEVAQFETAFGVGGALPLRSNLTFDVEGSLEDAASGEYTLHGAVDAAGGAAGTLSLRHVSYDLDGTIFACKDASVRWSARRLGP